jgi:hypothetical protein
MEASGEPRAEFGKKAVDPNARWVYIHIAIQKGQYCAVQFCAVFCRIPRHILS